MDHIKDILPSVMNDIKKRKDEYELEERIAILTIDGGMGEEAARRQAAREIAARIAQNPACFGRSDQSQGVGTGQGQKRLTSNPTQFQQGGAI